MTTYEHIAEVLTPEAAELFEEMVQTHLAASGDRMFLQADSIDGSPLLFLGQSRRNWEKVDRGALDDLVGYGLLRRDYSSRSTPNYRVSGESLAFHRWWMDQRASALEQVDTEAQRLILSDG
ncbi:MAG TPA: hypothetical protein VFU19_14840 [Iamia sp.]|nr:hypothetical protein [Iamia sp.]